MKRFIGACTLLLLLSLVTACSTETAKVQESFPEIEREVSANTGTQESVEDKADSVDEGKSEGTASSTDKAESTTNYIDAKVLSITDGDTIKVLVDGKEESIRFLLVDTPETSHPRLGKQPFGEEAKAFTANMLEGKTAQLEKDVSERDKYGRFLAYVYVDGKSVQEELLKNGLARVAYVYPPNTKHVDRYYEIQKEAQNRAVGIWSIENYATDNGFNTDAVSNATTSKNEPAESTPPAQSGECNIKGNISSNGDKIYHMPGQQFYNKTEIEPSKGEKFFCSREEAEASGFRASKR